MTGQVLREATERFIDADKKTFFEIMAKNAEEGTGIGKLKKNMWHLIARKG